MLHIVDRFLIHFFASAGILLMALFALRFLQRRRRTQYLPGTVPAQVVFCALSIFAIAALREAWDVAHGQALAKAFADYSSWASGCAGSAWGLIRTWRGKL